MKTNKILVSADGTGLTLASGRKATAAYPAGKGQKTSYLLIDNGKLATLHGSRIAGVGAERYFLEHGFELAQPGDAVAAEFADMLDARDGTALVEASSREFASRLTRELGGQQCTFVPFDEDQLSVPVMVAPPRSTTCVAYDLVEGFCSGVVQAELSPNPRSVGFGSDVQPLSFDSDVKLSAGWLVDPYVDPGSMPRNTEYGGIVERAVFVICNSGLGALTGAKNLECDEDAALDDPYPRGKLVVTLKNGDLLTVGIDAADELGVQYTRNGVVLYSRERTPGNQDNPFSLGAMVGAIAAVLVRVQELDAEPVKTKRPRALKAA